MAPVPAEGTTRRLRLMQVWQACDTEAASSPQLRLCCPEDEFEFRLERGGRDVACRGR